MLALTRKDQEKKNNMMDGDKTEQMVLEIMEAPLQHLTMLLFNEKQVAGVLTIYLVGGSVCVYVRVLCMIYVSV